MKTLLESMDLFAHQISFNYRKKKVFHSFFGIGLSFVLYSLMIYLLYYFSIDFIRNENPKVTYKETEFDETIKFPIDDIVSQFSLYLRLDERLYANQDLDEFISKHNNTQFLSGIAYLNLVAKYGPFDFIKVKTESTRNFLVKFDCHFSYSKVCVYLGQTWDPEQINILNVTKFRTRLTENQTYISYTETVPFDRNEKLNFEANPNINLQLGIEFQEKFYSEYLNNNSTRIYTDFKLSDNIINTNDIGFFKKFENSHASNFGTDIIFKEFDYYEYIYRMVRVRDDRGIIFSRLFDNIKMQKDNIYIKKTVINEHIGIQFASINFDKVMKHYDRVYRKLQNIFADIGGIFNSFVLIGHLIIFQFNYKKFNYDLINFLFHPDDQEEHGEKAEHKLKRNLIASKPKNLKNLITEDLKFKKNNYTIVKDRSDFSVICNTENNRTLRKHREISFEEQFFEMKNINSKNKVDDNSIFESKLGIINNIELINNNQHSNVIQNPNNNNNIQKDNNNAKGDLSRVKDILSDISSISKIKINKFEDITANKQLEIRILNYLKNEKNTNRKFIKFTTVEFIKLFLCCKKLKSEDLLKKERIFDSAEKKIIDYFDILTYTRFHEEFEKLKAIIFNKYQLSAFEYTKNRNISEILGVNLVRGILDSVSQFKKKIKEDDLNELDNKLLSSFNQEYIRYIYS